MRREKGRFHTGRRLGTEAMLSFWWLYDSAMVATWCRLVTAVRDAGVGFFLLLFTHVEGAFLFCLRTKGQLKGVCVGGEEG